MTASNTTSNTNILIKRSLLSGNAAPSSLKQGELAYSYNSNTLFIGTEGSDGYLEIGNWSNLSSNITSISGSTTYGSTTAIPNITVDKHGKIVDITTSTIATTLSISADSGSNDSINLLNDTLNIAGGFGIKTSTDGSYGVTVQLNNTNVILANTNGYQTIDGTLNISGNLNVIGTTTTIDTVNLVVEEPMIFLANNNTSGDVVDIGFAGLYNNGAANVWTGLIRHAGDADKNYHLFKEYTLDAKNGSFDIVTANAQYATLQVNDLITGNNAVLKDNNAGSISWGYDSGTVQGCASVAIGYNSGQLQGCCAVALGNQAGKNHQYDGAVAIGAFAGVNSQLCNSIAIGLDAGQSQAWDAVALGRSAGSTNQSYYSVAVGRSAGETCQGYKAIAMGRYAGQSNQQYQAVALGTEAGRTCQKDNAVAIGSFAGQSFQGYDAISIGSSAGRNCQGTNAIAIGNSAGYGYCTAQGNNSIAIGACAGYSFAHACSIILNASGTELNSSEAGLYIDPIRANNAVGGNVTAYNTTTQEVVYTDVKINNQGITLANGSTISDSAGSANVYIKFLQQTTNTGNVAFYDPTTGELSYSTLGELHPYEIANGAYAWYVDSVGDLVGPNAGKLRDSSYSVQFGFNIDDTNINTGRVSIGYSAGNNNQGSDSVAMGHESGSNNQGSQSVAIGRLAALNDQGNDSVAIGYNAASNTQGQFSVAIGAEAGYGGDFAQGQYSIALGYKAGYNRTYQNSIILNASGVALNSSNAGFYVSATRYEATQEDIDGIAFYNPTTKEMRYSYTLDGGAF
jgi:hypothetical protein